MKTLDVSVMALLAIAGMALVVGYLMLLITLPSDARPAMDLGEVIRAAERCEADHGVLEVTTDMRRRPIMVACLVNGESDE